MAQPSRFQDYSHNTDNVVLPHGNLEEHALPTPPRWLTTWENRRPRWLAECLAEFFGVFIYVYCGVGATASFFVSTAAERAGFGDLFTIGSAYGLGISFAIIVAGGVSGAHVSPGFTIAFAIYRGFPWRKVPYYIISQIFGAFIAALCIYGQYGQQLRAIESALIAQRAGALIFTPSGPAGVGALFPNPGQDLGRVFLNELIATMILAVIVFAVIDPTNVFVRYPTGPFIIGGAYAAIIWAFALDSVALNSARDLGGRFAAAALYGAAAFPARYTALACLTNILGTILGGLIQVTLLSESARTWTKQQHPELVGERREREKMARSASFATTGKISDDKV